MVSNAVQYMTPLPRCWLFERSLCCADAQGDPRTIYSLRHSSIMFRLLYGASIDTLKLARNARTSPEMIDRFYAAPLMGEMAIQELQAKRRPRPWER